MYNETISEVFPALVGNEKGLFTSDAIAYENKLWIVPEWLDNYPQIGLTTPKRIICIEYLKHQKWQGKIVLSNPIPSDIIEGISDEGYTIQHLPPYFLSRPGNKPIENNVN